MLHVTRPNAHSWDKYSLCVTRATSFIYHYLYSSNKLYSVFEQSIFIGLLSIIKALHNILRKINFSLKIPNVSLRCFLLHDIIIRGTEKRGFIYLFLSLFIRDKIFSLFATQKFVRKSKWVRRDESVRNLSEHRCRPTPPTWPDVNAHSRALKTDPKHTTRQWSIIISSRPPPRTRENAGRCAAASFSGAIKSGLFDSRKSRDKIETRTTSVFGAPTNQFELWLVGGLLRADRLRADKLKRKSASLTATKGCRRMQFGVINRICSCAKGSRRQDAMSFYRSQNKLNGDSE